MLKIALLKPNIFRQTLYVVFAKLNQQLGKFTEAVFLIRLIIASKPGQHRLSGFELREGVYEGATQMT